MAVPHVPRRSPEREIASGILKAQQARIFPQIGIAASDSIS